MRVKLTRTRQEKTESRYDPQKSPESATLHYDVYDAIKLVDGVPYLIHDRSEESVEGEGAQQEQYYPKHPLPPRHIVLESRAKNVDITSAKNNYNNHEQDEIKVQHTMPQL